MDKPKELTREQAVRWHDLMVEAAEYRGRIEQIEHEVEELLGIPFTAALILYVSTLMDFNEATRTFHVDGVGTVTVTLL